MSSSTKRRALIRIAVIVIGIELALAFALIGVYKHFIPFPPGLSNEQGYHYGHDFIVYYAAARLALDGRAESAYDLDEIHSVQEGIVGPIAPLAPWVYPPTFLLFVIPFGLLPYIGAYAAWCAAMVGIGVLAARSVVQHWWATFCVVLFPATWLNLFAGQNGGLTAGLMLGGLGLLHRHPAAAGVMFGLMSYKPQFGLLVPVALAAGRHWVAFASAAASVVGLTAFSFLAFGSAPWERFLAQAQSDWTTQTDILWWKTVTVYPMARLAGLEPAAAAVTQAVSSLIATGLVIYAWLRPRSAELQASALAFGTLLAMPRAMMYDLALLLVPIFFVLARIIRESSLQDWLFLSLLWICPMVGFFIFENLNFQVWPVVLWAGMVFCIIRYRTQPAPKHGCGP